MFSFSILQLALRFADVEVIAIPTTCLVDNLRPLGTIQAIFVGKERFDSQSVIVRRAYGGHVTKFFTNCPPIRMCEFD